MDNKGHDDKQITSTVTDSLIDQRRTNVDKEALPPRTPSIKSPNQQNTVLGLEHDYINVNNTKTEQTAKLCIQDTKDVTFDSTSYLGETSKSDDEESKVAETQKLRMRQTVATMTNISKRNLDNKDNRRMVSSVRQSTRSGFGGTGFEGDDNGKTLLTPSERLKFQLKTGIRPHPLVILPDDGKFWSDPPANSGSNVKYLLSCFDMETPWRQIYGHKTNIIENQNEICAEMYKKNFSEVEPLL